MARLPNFLVVGSAKSGTTSLYHYLRQHPDIYMSPVKEPEYFSFAGEALQFIGPDDQPMNYGIINNPGEYAMLFDEVADEHALGECSTSYLYVPRAADHIQAAIPDCKIIIILRNPVDRTYSHYQDHVRAMVEPLTFEDALAAEDERAQANWRWGYQYLGHSRYYKQVQRYIDHFGRDKVMVCLFDQLVANPLGLMGSTYRFLGVDDAFQPDISTVHNPGGLPKRRWLQQFVTSGSLVKRVIKPIVPNAVWEAIRRRLVRINVTKGELAPATRQQLNQLLKDDILALQELVGLDLSRWLE